MIATVLQYQRAGLCVLPALVVEKRPALPGWKQWQSKLPTEAEVRAWFAREAPDAACCLITGAVSTNLEMLDFDQRAELFPAWEKLVQAESPGLLDRLVVEKSQSGGLHVIYRCGEPVCGNLHLAQRAVPAPDDKPVTLGGKGYRPRRNAAGAWEVILTLIETRGEGGLFLCHPSPGYELLQGEIANVPVLTSTEREILLEAAWALNEVVPSPVAVPPSTSSAPSASTAERPGDAYNQRGDVPSVLRKHSWTLVRDGENQYWRRPGKPLGWSATLKGGVLYVFSSSASPFEQGRAYGPFAVYTMLEHNGDFTRAAAALRSEGYGSPVPPDLPAPFCPPTPEQPEEPEYRTLGQLVEQFPKLRPPLVHGLLREGESANLIASPKVGKSWMAIDLALSVATGGNWLGSYLCEPGKVLIIDNELHPETSAYRIPKVAEARGISLARVRDRLCIMNLRGRLRDFYAMEGSFKKLVGAGFKLIICDAFYRFLPRQTDENDNGAMAGLYNMVDLYAMATGAAFVLIHHSSKGDQSQKAVTDVGAGAGAQSRAPDAHIALRQHEEDDAVVMEAGVRNWPPGHPLCLRWTYPVWNPDPNLDPTALRSSGTRKRKTVQEEEPEPQWTPDRFVAAFVTPSPQPQAVILTAAKMAGISSRLAKDLLTLAEHQGLAFRWALGSSHRADFASVRPPEGGAK